MKNLFQLIFISVIVYTAINAQSLLEKHLNSMVATEYSFSDKASEVGIRDAFLAFIAEDGILLRPDPVNGKKFLEAQQSRPGLLSWYPSYAYMSSAGDMGCTTGPWEFRTHKDSLPVAYGNYCTVWKLQKNGNWEFLIDYGINNNKPERIVEGLKFNKNFLNDEVSFYNHVKKDSNNIVMELDQVFNVAVFRDGIKKNYPNVCDNDSRLLRDGHYPIIGKKEIISYTDTLKGEIKFQTFDVNSSLSNDFGYSYGSVEIGNDRSVQMNKNYYFRIWRKEESGWKIAVEVTNTSR